LSRYPNTPGVTVVITKQHLSSYMAEVPDDALCNLVLAAKRVAQILGQALPDASRTGLAFEGFGIDHIHAKLFPFHGTTDEWRPIESEIDTFFPNYEGYFCTNDGPRADDEDLACVVAEITAAQTSS
jgi:diadenosine tetraphosphate (Ap4A) HIT family hydrolase